MTMVPELFGLWIAVAAYAASTVGFTVGSIFGKPKAEAFGIWAAWVGVAAQAVGIARAAYEYALDYSRKREQFGRPIGSRQAIGFMLAGWQDLRLPPGSLGYVNVLGFLVIAPTTVIAAPVGARIAHGFTAKRLSVLFGLFLVIVSMRLFWRAMN